MVELQYSLSSTDIGREKQKIYRQHEEKRRRLIDRIKRKVEEMDYAIQFDY